MLFIDNPSQDWSILKCIISISREIPTNILKTDRMTVFLNIFSQLSDPTTWSACDSFPLLKKICPQIRSDTCWNQQYSPFAAHSPSVTARSHQNVTGEENAHGPTGTSCIQGKQATWSACLICLRLYQLYLFFKCVCLYVSVNAI